MWIPNKKKLTEEKKLFDLNPLRATAAVRPESETGRRRLVITVDLLPPVKELAVILRERTCSMMLKLGKKIKESLIPSLKSSAAAALKYVRTAVKDLRQWFVEIRLRIRSGDDEE